MEVTNVIEHEDGSATFEFKMTQDEMDFFVEYAIKDILKKQIERMEDEHRSDGS